MGTDQLVVACWISALEGMVSAFWLSEPEGGGWIVRPTFSMAEKSFVTITTQFPFLKGGLRDSSEYKEWKGEDLMA